MDDPYASIADLYDLTYEDFTDDIDFYDNLAQAVDGPLLELGVGSGRVALPLARRGYEVVGISLRGPARMRLRRYPHVAWAGQRSLALDLAPRSIYCLTGEARWGWQHAISPTPGLRYSLTFRSLRAGSRR